MDLEEVKRRIAAIPHWHHEFEIVAGVRTPGSYNPQFMLDDLGLPADLTGLRALDVGSSDGYFSMHLARRGAQVTAVDYRSKDAHGFAVMEAVSGLKFTYKQRNIYELDRSDLGGFDVVLCLGLLYHLPDMVRALNILRSLCDGTLFLETECEPDLMPGVAVARYYEAATLSNDRTNFWAPNHECVLAMLRDAGFVPKPPKTWARRMLVEAPILPKITSDKMTLAYGRM